MQLLILAPLHCIVFFFPRQMNISIHYWSILALATQSERKKWDYVGKIPKRRTPYLCHIALFCWVIYVCWWTVRNLTKITSGKGKLEDNQIQTTGGRCLVFLGSPTTHPTIYPVSIKRSRNTHSFLGSKEKGLAFELRFTFWGGLVVGPSLIAEISAVSYAIDLNFSSWKVLRFAIICCRPNKTALFFSFVISALTTQLIWLLNFQSTKFCPDSSHILFHHSFV